MKETRGVDFIGIGAQKSGTSWLYRNLRMLPEFSLHWMKEYHYFDRDTSYGSPNKLAKTYLYQRVFDYKWLKSISKIIWTQIKKKNYKDAKWLAKYYLSTYTDEWYVSLFQSFEGLTGEVTPSYAMLRDEDIQRMYKTAPQVKLIFLVRNPIDRVWSAYKRLHKNVENFNVDQISHQKIIRFINAESQELRGDYLRTIKAYKKVYPGSQILIGFYDAIQERPLDLLSQVVSHIGGNGDPGLIANNCAYARKFNASREIPCPPEIKDYLKNKYYSQIKELAERYGSYFQLWFESTYGETIPNRPLKLVSSFTLA